MVEGSGLENRRAGNRTVGSNPTPSAIPEQRWALRPPRLRARPAGSAIRVGASRRDAALSPQRCDRAPHDTLRQCFAAATASSTSSASVMVNVNRRRPGRCLILAVRLVGSTGHGRLKSLKCRSLTIASALSEENDVESG